MDLAARKAELRREMAARRSAVGVAEAASAGRALARQLADAPELAAARRVALYAAVAGELSTAPLCRTLRAGGTQLLWPRLRGGELEFAACDPEALEPGWSGIPSPPEKLPAVSLGPAD